MKIQSLSVVVPNKACINNCKFCVSHMHCEDYGNENLDIRLPRHAMAISNRMEFARDNDCNIVMLTGTSEPQQNDEFLRAFGEINRQLPSPFKWIEMQTTGAGVELELVYKSLVCSNAFSIEKDVHSYFDSKRTFGEWFKVDVNEAVDFLER